MRNAPPDTPCSRGPMQGSSGRVQARAQARDPPRTTQKRSRSNLSASKVRYAICIPTKKDRRRNASAHATCFPRQKIEKFIQEVHRGIKRCSSVVPILVMIDVFGPSPLLPSYMWTNSRMGLLSTLICPASGRLCSAPRQLVSHFLLPLCPLPVRCCSGFLFFVFFFFYPPFDVDAED
jgi:hypothetical protein